MDELERCLRALPRLPIFPLPGAVLLPHGIEPLHVFEPRYRKMIRDAAAGPRVLALANIPDDAAAAARPPRVLPILGVGVLARVDPLPDGRFHVLLKGVVRARIVAEAESGEPYRIVNAEPLEAHAASAEDLRLAEELRNFLLALAAQAGPASGSEKSVEGDGLRRLLRAAARLREPAELADVIGAALLQRPGERQRLLESTRVADRLHLVREAAVAALALSAPRPTLAN